LPWLEIATRIGLRESERCGEEGVDRTAAEEGAADPVGIGGDEIGGRCSKDNLAFLLNGYREATG